MLPYPDATHKGVEINSPTLVSISTSGALSLSGSATSIEGSATAYMSGGLVAVKASTILDLEAGTFANLDASTLVNIGMTTAAGATIATTDAVVDLARGTQLAFPSAAASVTEIAVAVDPGEVPASRASIFGGNFVERQNAPMTSFMGHDDDANGPQ